MVPIRNPQLMAMRADCRHRIRLQNSERAAPLQAAEKQARFQPGTLAEGRRLYLAFQPNNRFVRLSLHGSLCPK